jgi:hypothetical protein
MSLDRRSDPPPPPMGERLTWQQVPLSARRAVDEALGSPVIATETQPTGFSPGVAVRLRLADRRVFFAKAVGPEPNPDAPFFHRREAQIVQALPARTPMPRLLHVHDEGEDGWVVLVFEAIDGVHPQQPWQPDELDRVTRAMVSLSETLTPSPIPVAEVGTASKAFATTFYGWSRLVDEQPSRLDRLDAWSLRHLDALAALEQTVPGAVVGDTLLHFDLRADNMLLTSDRVWFLDWPHVRVGAAWADFVLFAPSVTMQGGPPPEEVVARHPAYATADPDALTAAIVGMAGFFTHRSVQPPPPGLPTLRPFQAAQGAVARQWVAERTGWR